MRITIVSEVVPNAAGESHSDNEEYEGYRRARTVDYFYREFQVFDLSLPSWQVCLQRSRIQVLQKVHVPRNIDFLQIPFDLFPNTLGVGKDSLGEYLQYRVTVFNNNKA